MPFKFMSVPYSDQHKALPTSYDAVISLVQWCRVQTITSGSQYLYPNKAEVV